MIANLATPSCLLLVAFSQLTLAAENVDYLKQVKPILTQRCYACHGALKQEAGLRLDTAELVRRGSDGGPAIVEGNAAGSHLIERISASDADVRMPPEGKPLSASEIARIAAWINQGSVGPADEKPQADPRRHWSFIKPTRPPVPTVNHSGWVLNPIDAFVTARHERLDLTPSPRAPKHVLMRRVYLDLIGLPPTRDELHNFLADDSPDAYDRVVERLLSSPHYGERWGRHWMDVWRYSDWYGRRQVSDVRNSYPHIWRWRDWIVRSLNQDKGYDRMIVEMLAADEVAPADDDAIAATGFIVRNWFSLNYDQWMQDLAEHTGKAFLGLRLNCAMCHDHKYDPISQQDYFRFRAFFEPLELRHDRVPGGPHLSAYKKYVPGSSGSLKPIEAGLARVFDTSLDAKTYMYRLGDARDRFNRPPVEPGVPSFLIEEPLRIDSVDLPPRAYYPGLKQFVRSDELATHRQAVRAAERELETVRTARPATDEETAETSTDADTPVSDQMQLAVRVAESQLSLAMARLASLEARIAADDARYLNGAGNSAELAAAASAAERVVQLNAAIVKLAAAEQTLHLANRKASEASLSDDEKSKARQALNKAREELAAAKRTHDQAAAAADKPTSSFTPLSPKYPERSSGRRRALARWIANRENPLTARVAVNHIWMRHFGRPLVESVFDFGRSGRQPTHPELLDWLACELMEPSRDVTGSDENGRGRRTTAWSMKHLHRLIVTSNTYQMHSKETAETAANRSVDPDNRHLWRVEPRRVEGEVVRDSILHLAGVLDPALGGNDIDPKLASTTPRRSLYFTLHPEAGGRLAFMAQFDPPDPGDCYRRTDSIVPQQALALTNSSLSLGQSRILAGKLWKQIEQQSDKDHWQARFVVAAFEQVLCRQPGDVEQCACLEFLARQVTLFSQTKSGLLPSQAEQGIAAASTDPHSRAREGLVRALFNHHHFVTVR